MSDLNAQVELLRDEQKSKGKLLKVYALEWSHRKAFRSESITHRINRRLYLESLIEVQVLLILTYMLHQENLKILFYTFLHFFVKS